MKQGPNGTEHSPCEPNAFYGHLLDATHRVSLLVLSRAAALCQRYPSSPPVGTPLRTEDPDESPVQPRQERRSHPRARGRPVRATGYGVDFPAELETLLLDESASGVGLWSPQAALVGALLYLLRADAPDGALGRLVRVQRCQAEGSGWLLGCQLLRTVRAL
jgi:hypothetical protein